MWLWGSFWMRRIFESAAWEKQIVLPLWIVSSNPLKAWLEYKGGIREFSFSPCGGCAIGVPLSSDLGSNGNLHYWLSWDLPKANLGISQPLYSYKPVSFDNSPGICMRACTDAPSPFLWRTETNTPLLLHGCFVLILHNSIQTQLPQPDFSRVPDLTSVLSSVSAPLLFPLQPLCQLVMRAGILTLLFTILSPKPSTMPHT